MPLQRRMTNRERMMESAHRLDLIERILDRQADDFHRVAVTSRRRKIIKAKLEDWVRRRAGETLRQLDAVWPSWWPDDEDDDDTEGDGRKGAGRA